MRGLKSSTVMTIKLICSGLLHFALQKPPRRCWEGKLQLLKWGNCGYTCCCTFLATGTQISTSGTYLPIMCTAKRCQLPPTVEALLTFRKSQLHPHTPVWAEQRKARSSNPNSPFLFLPTSLHPLHCQQQNQAQTQTTQRAVHGAAAFPKLSC